MTGARRSALGARTAWRLVERWLSHRIPARALDAVLGDLESDYLRERTQGGGMRAALWLWREARSVASAYRLSADAASGSRAIWRHLGGDARQTLRLLARSPGYVATVVLGLGAGLAVSIAMVSVLNTIFHGDGVGITHRESLGRLQVTLRRDSFMAVRSWVTLDELTQFASLRGHHLVDIAGIGSASIPARGDNHAGVLPVRFVTRGYFDVLGTAPAAGRLLAEPDHQEDTAAVVIGHRLWLDWFAGADDALGRTVAVGDQLLQIVGVAPARFVGTGAWATRNAEQEPQLWLAAEAASRWPAAPGPDEEWLTVFARLDPESSRDAAVADLAPAAGAMSAAAGDGGQVTFQLYDAFINDLRTDAATMALVLSAFLGGPIALLLIGCANVANLRLARATARARELAVRASLGATRGQLLRLLSIEALLLTAGALAVGLVGASALVRRFGGLIWSAPIGIDLRVIGWAVVLAAGVMAFSGVAPALLVVRRSTAGTLRSGSGGGGTAHARLRHALVVAQIATSVVLLALGGLFARSLQLANDTAPELFDRIVLAELDAASQGRGLEEAARIADALARRFDADARVQAVGLAAWDVLGGPADNLQAAGAGGPRRLIRVNPVAPAWFDALEMRPVAGRLLRVGDPPSVTVLSATAAEELFPGEPAVGRHLDVIRFVDDGWTRTASLEVVGVVPDKVRDPRRLQSWRPFAYTPLADQVSSRFTLAVRTTHPGDVMDALRLELSAVDPRLAWSYVRTASDRVAEAGMGTIVGRFAAAGAVLGGAALALAALGLFAVLAYAVSTRRREIGIRMALGARAADVTGLVLRLALRLTVLGVVCGFLFALPLAYLMRVVFLGVSPFDPLALAPAVGVLLLTALGAGLVPALRAARVDPVATLRAE